MKKPLSVLGCVLMLGSGPLALAAAWNECDGVPVRPKYPPMGIFWDQCSIPEGSPQERALFTAFYETRYYVNAIGFGGGYRFIHNGRCLIEHDNGRSDAALVNRSEIDGRLGLTIKELDGCDPTGDEHIITADVMIAADLGFGRQDEAHVVTSAPEGNGTRLGALVMLHEVGHALGLEHTSAFAVMRDGLGARAPFVGMSPGSGGLNSALTGDDVYGISRIYGFQPSFRNLFVSSQVLLPNGSLVDNNVDPTRGDVPYADPLPVCAGDKVTFYVTVGNNSAVREEIDVAVHAVSNDDGYFFPASGALAVFTVALGQGVGSFPAEFTVPASLPKEVTHNIFVALPTTQLTDRKGYDNAARSALRIRRKPGC